MRLTRAHATRRSVTALSAFIASLWLSACAHGVVRTQPTPSVVTVRGAVFDSLTRAPLSGARIDFVSMDTTLTTTTNASGAFRLTPSSGTWLMKVEHPRFDSLRVVIPPRRVVVPRDPTFTLMVGTPSPATAARSLCGDGMRDDDVALVGIVTNAATHTAVDSASVFVKWVDLTLTARGVTRSTETRVAKTTNDGWYISCGVPAEATLLSWVERRGATTGAVALTLSGAPVRLDLTLDTTTRAATLRPDLEPDSSNTVLFPSSTGSTRLHVLVRDTQGRPVTNARVRILGRNTTRADDAGAVTFDSIAAGTQTLEVLSIGYAPERRVVNVTVGGEPVDTVVLSSLNSLLDTVRVVASRDPTGFEARRATRKGEFITADDVAKEDPVNTTHLLRTRSGLRYTFDRNGFAFIEVTTVGKQCVPLILVDGFPPGSAPRMAGQAVLDWIVHPDEIGGVEIYTTPDQVPGEFARIAAAPPCAAIVFWTRERLGLFTANKPRDFEQRLR